MTVAASGVTLSYESIADIVEALVHIEGKRSPIPGVDFEDTAQEIRLECLRVLKFYDSTRIGPSPYKFLQTCIHNFLYNQRRGIWVPNNPPCSRCPLWDKKNKLCTIDEVGCEKIVKFRDNMTTKANLKTPSSLEIDIEDNSCEEEIDTITLDNSIKQSLPKHLLEYYEKLKIGKVIPPNIKKQIQEIATQIINHE